MILYLVVVFGRQGEVCVMMRLVFVQGQELCVLLIWFVGHVIRLRTKVGHDQPCCRIPFYYSTLVEKTAEPISLNECILQLCSYF